MQGYQGHSVSSEDSFHHSFPKATGHRLKTTAVGARKEWRKSQTGDWQIVPLPQHESQITANGLKFLTVWFCSAVEKMCVFPITDTSKRDNALYEIQPMALSACPFWPSQNTQGCAFTPLCIDVPATVCPATVSVLSSLHLILKCMVLHFFPDQPEIKPSARTASFAWQIFYLLWYPT